MVFAGILCFDLVWRVCTQDPYFVQKAHVNKLNILNSVGVMVALRTLSFIRAQQKIVPIILVLVLHSN